MITFENVVGKEEISHYEPFHVLSHCFPKFVCWRGINKYLSVGKGLQLFRRPSTMVSINLIYFAITIYWYDIYIRYLLELNILCKQGTFWTKSHFSTVFSKLLHYIWCKVSSSIWRIFQLFQSTHTIDVISYIFV